MSGFFVDADHLFDHLFAYGVRGFFEHGPLSFFDATLANPFVETQKVYILFHGWEYLILGVLIWLFVKFRGLPCEMPAKLARLRRISQGKGLDLVFLSLLISYGFHLMFDQLAWSHSGWGYFITYRFLNNFSLLKL